MVLIWKRRGKHAVWAELWGAMLFPRQVRDLEARGRFQAQLGAQTVHVDRMDLLLLLYGTKIIGLTMPSLLKHRLPVSELLRAP